MDAFAAKRPKGRFTEDVREAIKTNLFPASHAAIDNWESFPWHRDRHGNIDTHKTGSPQALAIDVFGTIKVSPERHRILNALAAKCELSVADTWELNLEWTADKELLGEPRPTQVDVLATGQRAILVIECKFTEQGGGCSQPKSLTGGEHRGKQQCNGHYVHQTNPVNGKEARCALSGKEIQYWSYIPKVFGIYADTDHLPCPFRGEAYQWMRNRVLAEAMRSAEIQTAVLAAYADGDAFPTAKKLRAGLALGYVRSGGKPLVHTIDYQSIIALAREASEDRAKWDQLARHVNRKISAVADMLGRH